VICVPALPLPSTYLFAAIKAFGLLLNESQLEIMPAKFPLCCKALGAITRGAGNEHVRHPSVPSGVPASLPFKCSFVVGVILTQPDSSHFLGGCIHRPPVTQALLRTQLLCFDRIKHVASEKYPLLLNALLSVLQMSSVITFPHLLAIFRAVALAVLQPAPPMTIIRFVPLSGSSFPAFFASGAEAG